MKRILIALFAVLLSAPVFAQTAGNGPYYATPSWDQTLTPATRFIILTNFNSEAILDRETGLVWVRQVQASTTWPNANTQCLQQTAGGRAGWRLPTVNELASLFQPASATTTLAIPPGFIGLPPPAGEIAIWSATAAANPAAGHRLIGYTSSSLFLNLTFQDDFLFLSMCVRGGLFVGPQG